MSHAAYGFGFASSARSRGTFTVLRNATIVSTCSGCSAYPKARHPADAIQDDLCDARLASIDLFPAQLRAVRLLPLHRCDVADRALLVEEASAFLDISRHHALAGGHRLLRRKGIMIGPQDGK